MAKIKTSATDYVLVGGYILAFGLVYTNLPFWGAATIDFLLMLLLLGLLAFLHRGELGGSIIWDHLGKKRGSIHGKDE
jgi:hypothetical protein